MLELETKKEKIYLSVLVINIVILIFIIIYLRNNCPECRKTYSINPTQPVIVYKIG
jgi:hypothetical protein